MSNLFKTVSFIAISVVSLSMAGCEETEFPIPLENNPTSQQPFPDSPVPIDTMPAGPDSPTSPIPGNPVPRAEEDASDPSVPSVPGVLRKIKWTPLDYKEFEYNTQGDLLKYISQYNSVQGTDMVRREEYTYAYGTDGRIISVTGKDGIRTEYTYSGAVWSEALSFDKLNRPLRKYQFQFNAKKQLSDYTEFNVTLDGAVTPRSKTNFTYDVAGNLVHYSYYWYVESSKTFVRSTELQFSNFDSKKYPKNSVSFDYILQPLSFFVNNPGKKEILNNASPVEHYSYSYDVHGYPTRKLTSFTYNKPLPGLEAAFVY